MGTGQYLNNGNHGHYIVILQSIVQIEYFNNKVICDLVEEAHTGIIAVLDEACVGVGNVNDTVFLHALDSRLKNHKHFTSRQVNSQLVLVRDFVAVKY